MAWTGREFGGLVGPLLLFAAGTVLGAVLWRYLLLDGSGEVGPQAAQARVHVGRSRAPR